MRVRKKAGPPNDEFDGPNSKSENEMHLTTFTPPPATFPVVIPRTPREPADIVSQIHAQLRRTKDSARAGELLSTGLDVLRRRHGIASSRRVGR